MSRITIHFKNLCAFFTKKLCQEKDRELLVGLLDVRDFYDVQEKDFHYPKITVESTKQMRNPNGEPISVPQCAVYEGFDRPKGNCVPATQGAEALLHHTDNVFGEIVLEVSGVAPNLTTTQTEVQKADLEQRISARLQKGEKKLRVEAFGGLVDIRQSIYPAAALKTNPQLCKARFSFRHGVLSSLVRSGEPPVKFMSAAEETPENLPEPGSYPVSMVLEVEVPTDGFAVLRFKSSDARDYVFLGDEGREYFVTIENSPLANAAGQVEHNHEGDEEEEGETETEKMTNHFQFFYKLIETPQPLTPTYLPEFVSEEGTALPPSEGRPECMPGGFGDEPSN